MSVLELGRPAERLAWLAREIPTMPGTGIVYCLTVRDTEGVARWLNQQGIEAMAYSGDSDPTHRQTVEGALLANDVKVVVATSALGMGFDKPDLGFVIHYQSPGSAIAYYQQVGRAGRAVERAEAVLLRGHEDADIQDFFISRAFPPMEQAQEVVNLLQQRGEAVKRHEILAQVNVRPSRLDQMLKILEVEGAIEHIAAGYLRTLQPWTYPTERVERVTEVRRREQAAMAAYANTDECRMSFLRRQLDDHAEAPCARCDNCGGSRRDAPLDPAAVAEAAEFIRATGRALEPRKRWPTGVTFQNGNISAELSNEEGLILSVYGDGGWGSVVRQAKYHDHRYPDELVAASARQTAPQKEMENSAQQLRNVYGAFVVVDAPRGPVLLVDDIVDSRWTLTVVGAELRQAGVPAVFLFVLAKAVSS